MKNDCFKKHPLRKSLFGVPALHVLTLRPVTLRATCRDTMSDLSKSSWSIGNSGRAHMIVLMEEIRRSPVEVGSLIPWFLYIAGGAGFLPSTVPGKVVTTS